MIDGVKRMEVNVGVFHLLNKEMGNIEY